MAVRAIHTHLLHGWDVLIRDVPTDNPILKRRILPGIRVHLHRLDVSFNFTELTRTTRLLLVGIIKLAKLSDGLAECYSRFTSDASDVVFSLHSFNVDFKVKFAHTGDNGLLRLGINVNTECRIFFLEPVECSREVGGFVALWSDREGDDGIGDEH